MSDELEETRALLEAFQRVCLGAEAAREDLATLENDVTPPARFGLYRQLVRGRLRELVASAFPRTAAALGKERLVALADRHITATPPSSRFFREHAVAFAHWALPILGEDASPAFVVDLLRLELAQWQANYTPEPPIEGLVDFALELVPVTSATLATLRTAFGVHVAGDVSPAAGAFRIAVYRRPDHRVETRWMEPIWADLLDGLVAADRPAIECVRAVLAAHERAPDAAFVEEMTTFLSRLVENGALRGSRGA